VAIVLIAALARPQLYGNPAPSDSRPANQPPVDTEWPFEIALPDIPTGPTQRQNGG